MAKVPKQYEDVIQQAIDAQQKNTAQKKGSALAREVTKRFAAMISGQGREGASEEILEYVASNMSKVFSRMIGLMSTYKPTKRKGLGEDGGVITTTQDPWLWTFDGGGGDSGVDSGDEGDDGTGDEGGDFDFAPSSEIKRAQDMLYTVAAETGFGEDDDPFEFVRTVARRLGGRWGLNGKRGNPNDPSKDVLAWDIPGYKPQIFDVIGDAGGQNRITWQPLAYGQPSVWIAP